jgi:hypothetical protein
MALASRGGGDSSSARIPACATAYAPRVRPPAPCVVQQLEVSLVVGRDGPTVLVRHQHVLIVRGVAHAGIAGCDGSMACWNEKLRDFAGHVVIEQYERHRL